MLLQRPASAQPAARILSPPSSSDSFDKEPWGHTFADTMDGPPTSSSSRRHSPKTLRRSANLSASMATADNISKRLLRERQANVARSQAEFDRRVFEEARNLQRQIATCVQEANVYSELLNKPLRYRLARSGDGLSEGDEFWRRAVEDPQLLLQSLPVGTGERIEKALVESYDPNTGTAGGVFSVEYFFREHNKLRGLVKKYRSVVPAGEADVAVTGPSASPAGAPTSAANNTNSATAAAAAPVTMLVVGADNSSANLSDPTQYVRALLDGLVVKSRTFEEQLDTIHSLGWNTLM